MAVSMTEIINKANKVKPIATQNGIPVVSFEDQMNLAQADLFEGTVGLGIREMNADGTFARSRATNVAVRPNAYFLNRYKVARGKLYVVTDYRAITEQATNAIYRKQIPAFQFARDKETNELVFEKVVQISDAEFVADYTNTLDREAMEEILPLIMDVGSDIQADSMPI